MEGAGEQTAYLYFLQGDQPLVAVANCLVNYAKLPPANALINLEIGNTATTICNVQSRRMDAEVRKKRGVE